MCSSSVRKRCPCMHFDCAIWVPREHPTSFGCSWWKFRLGSVRELLAWEANRYQRDSFGRIPYMIALKHYHGTCAALLNPTTAEPLIWPLPLTIMSELNPEAKVLLEKALMEATSETENSILKGLSYSLPSSVPSHGNSDDNISEANETELCCICFDQVCAIEVQDCGHQMCACCTLALCCCNKPDPFTLYLPTPVCPFCRSGIARLVVAKIKNDERDSNNLSKPRKSKRYSNFSEGSSSFRGLSSAIGSFRKSGGRGLGRITDSSDWDD